ncbi:MAG: alpha-D-glucose phosphate-specific phosphoglucomutase [Alphaproteobacteria bacterium]|nr:alpha-D-glucose phosphate-specific phosphoglucomutase [Alphaproteobacteria bacterium]
MKIDPRAGRLILPDDVLDVSRLMQAFFDRKPDVANPAQRVSFGTSGHRGCAFDTTFNENHIVAITQSICRYRAAAGIDGPLYLGRDTHAVSEPAFYVALQVLAANGVHAMVDSGGGFTPTPVISHAILSYNRGRTAGLADGIVITPSHNPPQDGGFKYNPPHGGPAEGEITGWIEKTANELLKDDLKDVRRLGSGRNASPNVGTHDYAAAYIEDLHNVVRLEDVSAAGLRIGVDPLGGAAVAFWAPIAERYKLNLTVTDSTVDSTFRTVPMDWDGKIRMDCSSAYPMTRLLARRNDFDLSFANDTDADRHGIVTPTGLMPPNDYLAACALYLGRQRPQFKGRSIGKTVVSSSVIDRVADTLGTRLFEVPVGFKWFVQGLRNGDVYFCGEESAGSSFLRHDGAAWTTDKDGIIAGLLASEMTAITGKTPDQLFAEFVARVGKTYYGRIDSPAQPGVRSILTKIDPSEVQGSLGGDDIIRKFCRAPGNGAPIGGIKLVTANGWVAARPSGTEDIIKIYGESFVSAEHLSFLQNDAIKLLRLDVY